MEAIAGLNKFFAVLTPILCIFGLAVVIGGSQKHGMEQAVISLIVYMVLAPLVLWGTAELILLLIEVEKNTRRTSLHGSSGSSGSVPKDESVFRHPESENLPEEEKERRIARKLTFAPEGRTGVVRVRVRLTSLNPDATDMLGSIGFVEEPARISEKLLFCGAMHWMRIGTIDAARLKELASLDIVESVSDAR